MSAQRFEAGFFAVVGLTMAAITGVAVAVEASSYLLVALCVMSVAYIFLSVLALVER